VSKVIKARPSATRASGAPLLFLEGGPGYYGPRGFEQASAHGFVPASARTPADAFQVVKCAGHEEWMTGQLTYRDVWWHHDAARLERGDR
jgi:putative acetyltransferase